MKRVLAAAGLIGGMAVAAARLGGLRWRRETSLALERLLAAQADPPAGSGIDAGELPPPVARYLEFALPAGGRHIRTATVRWAGDLRMRPGARWAGFSADQQFTANPPGFVWNARMSLVPLVPVLVRDSYDAGGASMEGRVAGLLPVVDQRGSAELAQSALARWLGEAVWMPTALVPRVTHRGGLRWESIDDTAARATVTDGATRASADFRFAADGRITSMSTRRYRDVGGTSILTPFAGTYRDYVRRHGFMVPTSAEVAWLLPEGRFAYWRGTVRTIRYVFAPAHSSALAT